MTTVNGSTFGNLALEQPPGAKHNNTLDQTAFLKLMTTQLKTQDPFNPVDNTQMVAQMAQFSSVAGIAEMNKSLGAIAQDLQASRLGSAASWIGKNALVETDQATPLSDGSYRGEIALPDDASNVIVSLVDGNGQVVHNATFENQKAGSTSFAWDGKDAEGKPVPGPLRVVVNATGATGNVDAAIGTWTQITGVQSPAGGASTRLVTPLGLLSPDDAVRLG
ncbi:flagellar hook assembly protein FlgD [Sphingomonas cavernae]|uniref:Basal-body rod modification protein FlgD n=1 Tax=Sphingomonas cavernae TaxID=2320861 RepID=A0A418WPQ9_9SPHN|nr:flagellar hook capping FlgD N-terminal domain-containing protein [Sphingomonas cavernae]RJF93238.1 flagellar hook capping protein [Sphingomonas cavernae]